ncbi:MAG TPA: BON domain-containing protein [Luteitalea sp.]|nr:BON domain-containing protein [Luteitalea sp.]
MNTGTQLFRCAVPVCAVLLMATAAGAQSTTERKAREAKAETAQEAREAKQEARDATRKTGNAITDSWITMKVHSQFIPEDALEDSDIDVDTKAGVVTLNGTVVTAAGRSRAVAIAKATDGVKSVSDRLRVAPATGDHDTREAAGKAGAAAREGAREAKEAGRGAGNAVTDGWLTSKIYAQYIDEDALDDSDIDVDTNRGVVTLTGTAKTRAGVARAEAIAKATEGVKSVANRIKVGPEK